LSKLENADLQYPKVPVVDSRLKMINNLQMVDCPIA